MLTSKLAVVSDADGAVAVVSHGCHFSGTACTVLRSVVQKIRWGIRVIIYQICADCVVLLMDNFFKLWITLLKENWVLKMWTHSVESKRKVGKIALSLCGCPFASPFLSPACPRSVLGLSSYVLVCLFLSFGCPRVALVLSWACPWVYTKSFRCPCHDLFSADGLR